MQPDPSAPQHDPSTPPANPYAPPADPYAPPANPYAPPADPYAPPADPYAPPATSGSKQPYPPPPVNPYAMPSAPPSPPPPDPYAAPHPGPYGGVQMYPNAGYPFPAGKQNTLGLVSMILGIASVPLACCFLGLPVGIAAAVTGWLGQQKVEQGLADNRGQALAGMICGAIGALLGLGWGVLNLVGLAL
ncbi:DUF4190 domain-containing protein [Salinispora cortesiana]|uniref:DUF4190 domain-containing protein n=1 Tax=Salinispora cortesiana TaxID=1305843 RepID=UPI0003FE2968|nr:DUF4190 domain-containing protein [Salinispora cortesiana]